MASEVFEIMSSLLEYDPFLLGFGLFSGAFTVGVREGRWALNFHPDLAGFWPTLSLQQYVDVLLGSAGIKGERISELYTPNIFRL